MWCAGIGCDAGGGGGFHVQVDSVPKLPDVFGVREKKKKKKKKKKKVNFAFGLHG
jgi:hypothetical protein